MSTRAPRRPDVRGRRAAHALLAVALLGLAGCGTDREVPEAETSVRVRNDLPADFDREAFAASLGVPARLTYGDGVDFVLVPAGTFTQGSPSDEAGRHEEEHLHTVRIVSPYYLQVAPLTAAQWARLGGGVAPASPEAAAAPATVSRDEASRIAEVLAARQPGRAVRLPREAEWEWAARAGATGAFGAGCASPPRDCVNRLGLRGMHTGGRTWCRDVYAAYPHHATSDPLGPRRGTHFVVRGGTRDAAARSAARGRARPEERHGVRLVVEVGYIGRVPVRFEGVHVDAQDQPTGPLEGVRIQMISVVDRLTDRQAGRAEAWTTMTGTTPCTLYIRPGRYYARLEPIGEVREPFEQKVDVVAEPQTVRLHR